MVPLTVPDEARAVGGDRAFDAARFALHQRGADDVAFDRAVDVEVGRGLDVALDGDVGADHREGRAVSHGPRRGSGAALGSSARASSRTWGAVSRKGRGLTARSLMRTSKWRCGPVERPVLPISADHVAGVDLLADAGAPGGHVRVAGHHAVAVADLDDFSVTGLGAHESNLALAPRHGSASRCGPRKSRPACIAAPPWNGSLR